ncbi:MAG: hypothetical protein ACLS95_05530 [Clostridia bacterium]
MNKKVKIILTILGIILMLFILSNENNSVLANTKSDLPEYTITEPITSDTTWERGIYYINGNLTIEKDVTLIVQEGTIVNIASTKVINVYGNLILNGTAQRNINVQSKNEGEYWNYIYINDNGAMHANYTNIYGLKGAKVGTIHYFFDIYGSIYLDNVYVENTREDCTMLMKGKEFIAKNSILENKELRIQKYSKLDVQKNKISKIIIEELSNEDYIIKDNIILQEDYQAIELKAEFVKNELKIYNNLQEGENRQKLQFIEGRFTQDSILSGNSDYYFPNNLCVEKDVTLTVNENVGLKIGGGKIIEIQGNLILNGTPENKIKIQSRTGNEIDYWIYTMVGEEGMINAKYTVIEDLIGLKQQDKTNFFDILGSIYFDNVIVQKLPKDEQFRIRGKEIVIRNSRIENNILRIQKYSKLDVQNSEIARFIIEELSNEDYIIKDNIILQEDYQAIELKAEFVKNELKIYNNLQEGENRQKLQFIEGRFTQDSILSGNSDYYFPNNLCVEKDVTLTVNENVGLKIGGGKIIEIQGNLILNGTPENKIKIQSRTGNEIDYWIYTMVGEEGMINAKYTVIEDLIGLKQQDKTNFFDILGSIYFDNVIVQKLPKDEQFRIRGKEIVIRNSRIENNILRIQKYSKLDVQNSEIARFIIEELSNEDYIIKDNIILQEDYQAIELKAEFVKNELKIYNNLQEGENRQKLQFIEGRFTQDSILSGNSDYYFPNNLCVEKDVTLTVNENVGLKIGGGKIIEIQGNLILNGTPENKIKIQSRTGNEIDYWIYTMVGEEGMINAKYTVIEDLIGLKQQDKTNFFDILGSIYFDNVIVQNIQKGTQFLVKGKQTIIQDSLLNCNMLTISIPQNANILVENNIITNINISNISNSYLIRNNRLIDKEKNPLKISAECFNSNTLTFVYNNLLEGLERQYVRLPTRASLGDIYLTGDVDYYVEGCLSVPEGTTMIIDEGALLRLSSGAFVDVYGTLYINGKIDKEVVITHCNDMDYHGNGDIEYTSGIFIAQTGQAYINNMILKYASGYHKWRFYRK